MPRLLTAGLLATLLLWGNFQNWPYGVMATLAWSVVGLAGWPIALTAARAIQRRTLDMHVLVMLAVLGALLTAQWWEGAFTMWLFALSLWLEHWQVERARAAVQHSVVAHHPNTARRLRQARPAKTPHAGATHVPAPDLRPDQLLADAAWEEVPTRELQVGQYVLVRPGEHVPADGTVVQGISSVDQSTITGESMPLEKQCGDHVYAGSLNHNGPLVLAVEQGGGDSLAAQVEYILRQADTRTAPTQRMIDRFAAWYTPSVVVLAIVVALAPPLASLLGITTPQAPWNIWLHRSLVLLVISCPCALLISTPSTLFAGMHRAAKLGIVIKGGQFLEGVGQLTTLVFDKTGTLTTGNLELTEVMVSEDPTQQPLGPNQPADRAAGNLEEGHWTRQRALQVAASLEIQSEHPLAVSLRRTAADEAITMLPVEEVTILRGFGLQGSVQGEHFTFASARYFSEQAVPIPTGMIDAVEQRPAQSAAFLAHGRCVVAAFFFADTLRSDASALMERLRTLGIQHVSVMSGDRPSVVGPLQNLLKIDQVTANMLPLQKREAVMQLAQQRPQLAFVGDGVNDAAALQAAPLGIAFGPSASPLALHTADIVLFQSQLQRLGDLLEIGQRTRLRLWQNIAMTLFLKASAVMLAILGWAPMWLAVLADVGATLLVLANGVRK